MWGERGGAVLSLAFLIRGPLPSLGPQDSYTLWFCLLTNLPRATVFLAFHSVH